MIALGLVSEQTLITRFVDNVTIVSWSHASHRWLTCVNIAVDGSVRHWLGVLEGESIIPWDYCYAVLAVVLWFFIFSLKYFAAMTCVAGIIDDPA